MWNRVELKYAGKTVFMRNYWPCVLMAFLMMLGLTVGGKEAVDGVRNSRELAMRITSMLSGSVSASLLGILVFSVLEVSGCRFFMENVSTKAKLDRIGFGFTSGNYGTIVVAQLLRRIFIALWSLLLVVPGIMKAYSYCLVPYILADRTDVTASEALRISEEMMYGKRMEMFMLDLSFIGWHILTGLTGGILGVFYVNPYIQATKAEVYLRLRENLH